MRYSYRPCCGHPPARHHATHLEPPRCSLSGDAGECRGADRQPPRALRTLPGASMSSRESCCRGEAQLPLPGTIHDHDHDLRALDAKADAWEMHDQFPEMVVVAAD